MKPRLCSALLLIALSTACTRIDEPSAIDPDMPPTTNPLLSASSEAFGLPPFERIELKHFKPAIETGIISQVAEIDAIISLEAEPDFNNTIAAFEDSGRLLEQVSTIFYNLNSANTNDELQAIARELSPSLSEHRDNIYLNAALFQRVKAVWDKRELMNLSAEDYRLLEKQYKRFVRNGALLNDADQSRFREINSRLSLLSLEFGQNMLAATNAYTLHVLDEDKLSGLSKGFMESAARKAKEEGHEEGWLFTLHSPSLMPFLEQADNRDLRLQMWTAYSERCTEGTPHSNEEIIVEMVALRAERASLLGYPNHAAYVLEESMASDVEGVDKLLDQLWEPALAAAQREADDLQELIREAGEDFDLQPWDWRYYQSKLRSQRFDLDPEEVKSYFSAEGVKRGIFEVCKRLFGLSFERLEEVPLYHPNVMAYEVLDADSSHVGVLYIDLYTRNSKRGGAWMTSYRKQESNEEGRVAPHISIVCNFSPPDENGLSLLTFDEVTTFFHEFGHALHGLLSDVNYRSLAGTSVPRDFVELPSQVLENWASAPEVMKLYALHHESGEPIPAELVQKLEESGTFGEGFGTVEYLASTLLDMAYHTRDGGLDESPVAFEKRVMEEAGLMSSIIPRHRSTYFAHVFSGGYSSGYYSYIWSAVLDSDAFEAFRESGDLFNPELADKFRTHILSTGGTAEPMELYKAFRGAEPSIEPLLRKRGLSTEAPIAP